MLYDISRNKTIIPISILIFFDQDTIIKQKETFSRSLRFNEISVTFSFPYIVPVCHVNVINKDYE